MTDTERTNPAKIETLSDADLDTVIGAGDPVPYPDVGGGGGGKIAGKKAPIGIPASTTTGDETVAKSPGTMTSTTSGSMKVTMEGKTVPTIGGGGMMNGG